MRFRKAYTSALQFCERPEPRKKLEQTLSRIAGQTIRIDFGLLQDEAAGSSQPEMPPPRPQVNRNQRRAELMRHPLVRKAAELFDAEILSYQNAPPPEETEPVRGEASL